MCTAIGAQIAHTSTSITITHVIVFGSLDLLWRRRKVEPVLPNAGTESLSSVSAIYCPVCKRISPSLSLVGVSEIKYLKITTHTKTKNQAIKINKELLKSWKQPREKRKRS